MSSKSLNVVPSLGVVGVGDEVILFVVVVAVVLLPLLIAFVRSVFKASNASRGVRINPEGSAPEGRTGV